MQTGNTSDMIFDVAYLVQYISQFMTLRRATSSAPARRPASEWGGPQVWLKDGDEIRLGITGLGEQRQRVRRAVVPV